MNYLNPCLKQQSLHRTLGHLIFSQEDGETGPTDPEPTVVLPRNSK